MNKAIPLLWLFTLSILLTLFMGVGTYYIAHSFSSFWSACVGIYPAAVLITCMGDYDRLSQNIKKRNSLL